MSPQEVVALAMLDMDEIPEPETSKGKRFEAIMPVANMTFESIRSRGWYLTTAEQAKHIWTEHKGDPGADVGLPARSVVGGADPFGCFGCAGLFDGIGEYNP